MGQAATVVRDPAKQALQPPPCPAQVVFRPPAVFLRRSLPDLASGTQLFPRYHPESSLDQLAREQAPNALKTALCLLMIKGRTRQLRDRTERRGEVSRHADGSLRWTCCFRGKGHVFCLRGLLGQRCRDPGHMWVQRSKGIAHVFLVLCLIWGPG